MKMTIRILFYFISFMLSTGSSTCILNVTVKGSTQKLNAFPGQNLNLLGSVLFNSKPVLSGVTWEVLVSQRSAQFVPLDFSISPTLLNFTASPLPFSDIFLNRPTLSLPAEIFDPFNLYVFRLSSTQTCNNGQPVSRSSSITFQINDFPKNGAIAVTPTSGTNYETIFSLSTTGWTDGDVPLRFSFDLLTPDSPNPIPLTDFSTSSSLGTSLASLFKSGNRVIASCRDIYGATSSVTSTGITLLPIFIPGVTSTTQLQNDFNRLSDQDAHSHGDFAMALLQAQSLKNLSIAEATFLSNLRANVITRVLIKIISSRAQFPSVRDLSANVFAYHTALRLSASFTYSSYELMLALANILISDASTRFAAEFTISHSAGPILIPDFLGPSFLEIITILSDEFKKIQTGVQIPSRRRELAIILPTLSPTTAPPSKSPTSAPTSTTTSVVASIRKSLNDLVHFLNLPSVPGSPVKKIIGNEIEIIVKRESTLLVGLNGFLNTINFGKTIISFPDIPILSPETLRNSSLTPNEVDVGFIQFNFNIRELLEPGNNIYNETSDNRTLHIVPSTNVSSITFLFFLDSAGGNVLLDPFNLPKPLNITFPLINDGSVKIPDGNSSLSLECGAFDESILGWRSTGCSMIGFTSTTVTCSCTHASDFSAWNSFVENLGGGDVGIIVTIAIVTNAVLLPLIILFYMAFLIWAYRKDKKDAEGVHVGAILVLTKNRLKLARQQRNFFQYLRENASKQKIPKGTKIAMGTTTTTNRDPSMNMDNMKEELVVKSSSERNVLEKLKKGFEPWKNALLYDHSLFAIFFRFDPYYNRTERVTVIMAVICGNFFVSAFLFDLKIGTDLTTGFVLGVVVLSALIVSLPVKLLVRFLFRATKQKDGSTLDRVSQIFRISQSSSHNLLPGGFDSKAEQLDSEMLLSFRSFFIAKKEVEVLQEKIHAETVKGSSRWKGFLISLFSCFSRQKRRRTSHQNNMKKQLLTNNVVVEATMNSSDEENQIGNYQEKLRIAKQKLKDQEQRLKEACRASKNEWETVPELKKSNSNFRKDTLLQQTSSIMKFTALFYDDASGPPLQRPRYFRPNFIYIAWGITLLYLAACLIYSSYWMFAFTSIKSYEDLSELDEDQKEANFIISTWVLTSFIGVFVALFLSEPIFQLIRFVFVPFVLIRWGSGVTNSAKVVVVNNNHEDIGSLENKKQIQIEYQEKQLERKKGETRVELIGLIVFDFLFEMVQSLS